MELDSILTMHNQPLEYWANRIKKRVFDILVSWLVVLFILSWFTPLIAVFIVVESKGPIFFKQLRTGKDGKIFSCLKFRTMYINEHSDIKQAVRNDTRVTKIGNFLRRTSLDELPQFINVLRGDMTIVGPRPHMLIHTDQYSKLIKRYMVRQVLKPGITGWAQVNGFRGETQTLDQMEKRVQHDLWYLENWSFWLDVKIIWVTVFNGIRGEKNAV